MKSFPHVLAIAIMVFLIQDGVAYSQWQRVGLDTSAVHCISLINNDLFAGTDNSGLYRSTDNGATWVRFNNGITSNFIKTVTGEVVGSVHVLFAGSNQGGVYGSSDDGATWGPASAGLGATGVHALVILGFSVFAGLNGDGAYRLDLTGSWTQINAGLGNIFVHSLTLIGSNILAGTENGVYQSSDGASWTLLNTSTPITAIRGVAVQGTNIYVASNGGGVFVSTNSGASWTPRTNGLTITTVRAVAANTSSVFAGTNGGGVYASVNGGVNWQQANTGLGSLSILSLLVTSTHVFAGTAAGVYRRPLIELAVRETAGGAIPSSFALSQNYPNPFNPSTIITYDLPSDNDVRVKVFDMLGKEITTLVNAHQTAGRYQVDFDGKGLASGVYFYRLQAGSTTLTKQMVLMR